MRLSRLQFALLIAVTIFFAFQFLPHHFTSLIGAGAMFLYIPLAMVLLLMILFGFTLALLVWIAAPNEVSARYRRNWCWTCYLRD